MSRPSKLITRHAHLNLLNLVVGLVLVNIEFYKIRNGTHSIVPPDIFEKVGNKMRGAKDAQRENTVSSASTSTNSDVNGATDVGAGVGAKGNATARARATAPARGDGDEQKEKWMFINGFVPVPPFSLVTRPFR
jgi:hypothetical protein